MLVDLQKFEIIVNAMLGWSDEAKAPRKTPGRHAAPVQSRFAGEDEDDLIEEDLEPEDEAPGFPRAGAAADVDEEETID
jgi:hypothetical protein